MALRSLGRFISLYREIQILIVRSLGRLFPHVRARVVGIKREISIVLSNDLTTLRPKYNRSSVAL